MVNVVIFKICLLMSKYTWLEWNIFFVMMVLSLGIFGFQMYKDHEFIISMTNILHRTARLSLALNTRINKKNTWLLYQNNKLTVNLPQSTKDINICLLFYLCVFAFTMYNNCSDCLHFISACNKMLPEYINIHKSLDLENKSWKAMNENEWFSLSRPFCPFICAHNISVWMWMWKYYQYSI